MVAPFLAAALSACAAPGPLAEAEKPLELSKTARQSWYELGVQMLAVREYAQAERAFTQSLSAEGVSSKALTGLGVTAARMGRLSKARWHLEQARALAPEDPQVHNNLGVVLYDMGEYHAARQAFRTAFLVTSGSNEMAAFNLEKTERAIALADYEARQNPAVSHDVQRLGASEYRLLDRDASAPETTASQG